jgi:hypothetical protein
MTRRRQRRPDEPAREDERVPARAPGPSADVLELQRSAGNAAVTRVLAREPAAPTSPQFTKPDPLVIGKPNPLFYMPKLDPEVEKAVDAWLKEQAPGLGAAAQVGAMSIPEVIDLVRRGVPSAADASAEAIRARVQILIPDIPAHRGKRDLAGQRAEWAANIANKLPSVPTKVTIGGSNTSLTIGIEGAELKTAAGVQVKADDEGAEIEAKKGGAKVGASGKWDGSSFALKTEVSGVKFGGKVERKGESWKWSGGLVFPLAGDEVDELPDVEGVVASAHGAIADSLGHLRAGGSPTDAYVTERMGKIKPAIDAAGKIASRAKKPGATLRVTVSGDDGGFTAGVSLVIVF